MLLAILAAAATTAAVALPPPKTVSPLVVTAQPKSPPPADASVVLQSDDDAPGAQHVSIWPAGAWQRKANGHVTLTCFIDVHGLAERCRVAYEDPQGLGFGAAALELRPTLQIPPRKGPDGRPVGSEMNVALEFKAPDFQQNMQDIQGTARIPCQGCVNITNLQLHQDPIELRHVVWMNHPVWVKAPSFDDLAKAYPKKGAGLEGYAVAHCEVLRSGALTRCIVAKEEPVGHDFALAALKLAETFRVSPDAMRYAPHGAPIEVDIPIRFPAPAALDRAVTAPAWIAGYDPEQAPKLFPPDAAARGLTSGRGVAKCQVTPEGALSDCAPDGADPDGMGFSEAAVKLAATMRMNLWSSDAQPVAGGTVRVAIRLNLDQTQP
jgi:hypothetical protein